MKIVLKILTFSLIGLLLTGCATQPEKSSEPIGKSFMFDRINLNFIQKHYPKTKQYQSKKKVESKLNNDIMSELIKHSKFNKNSNDRILIVIDFKRIFNGEDLPFEALRGDSIGIIKIGYNIKIVRGSKVLRYLQRENIVYDPGFVGNLKTISKMNTNDSFENNVIKALSKEIVEQIAKMK